MNHDFREEFPRPYQAAAGRRSANYFCIHSYAGEAGPPCGWRGRITVISSGEGDGVRRCPRCGRSTLMEIPVTETEG
jgi:hypothetical protein